MVVQGFGLHTLPAEGPDSIPGQENTIPQAGGKAKKKKKKKKKKNKKRKKEKT